MKKIFAILAMAFSASVFADSATLEYQGVNSIGAADQKIYALTVKHNINSVFAGDVGFSNSQVEGTSALGARIEAGLTATTNLGLVNGYVRTALGQKFSNTGDYTYYSVEPGVTKAFGAFTARVGYRFRDATDTNVNTAENTGTARYGVSYALSKADSIGVRYDRVTGDSNQKVTAVNYTRSF